MARAHQLLTQVLRATGEHPAVLHLLALVEKRRGAAEAARQAFSLALLLEPSNAEIATNAGHFFAGTGAFAEGLAAYEQALLSRPARLPALRGRATCLAGLGRVAEAREAYRRLVALAPDDVRNWTAWAAFERAEGDLDAAAEAYDRALSLAPAAPLAIHGRARVALERGEAEASGRFAVAERLLPADAEVALGAAEAAVAGSRDEALARLEALTGRFPLWVEPHAALARLRWETGDREGFAASLEAAVEAHPEAWDLWTALVAAYSGADLHERALDAAARAASASDGDPRFRLLEAAQATDVGDLDRAEALFASLPQMPGAAVAEARYRLKRQDIDRAEKLLDRARADAPDDVLAWAWTGLVWRLNQDGRSEWLHQPERLIGTARLEAEAGEIEALADAVRALHHGGSFPLGQSLRGGTQTRGRLFARQEPAVRRLRSLLGSAVERFWESLPPADPDHPLLKHRDSQPRFAGSWSVRLTDGGLHIAHVHPAGLLSSACHLHVPAPAAAGEGALEIGRPPAGLDLALGPLATITPEPGKLALFPSYLFHGTRPFGAGERLSVAFDLVAGAPSRK